MVTKQLQKQVLQLSPGDRAELVRLLLASLEGTCGEDFADAWIDEAEKRLAAYDNGRVPAKPAAEALRQARSKIR